MSFKGKIKYKNLINKKKRHKVLTPGISGFLCTCNSKVKEKDCIRESYSILNEFADKLYGNEKSIGTNENEETSTDNDVIEEVKNEIASIQAELKKKPAIRRFQVTESGANGIVFIRTTIPDPVHLAHTIARSSINRQKSKFLLRLLPVEMTCKAFIEDISIVCDSLFNKYFVNEAKTFAIVYNHRHNDNLRREDLIEKIAGIVVQKNKLNKADLKNPQLTILIEIIKSICCISVVPDFYALKKYNLVELAVQGNSFQNL